MSAHVPMHGYTLIVLIERALGYTGPHVSLDTNVGICAECEMLPENAKAARGLLIARALSKDKDVDLRLILGVMGDAVNHEKIQALEEEMEDVASDEEKRADFDVELEEQRQQRMQSGMSEEMQALEETLEKDKA